MGKSKFSSEQIEKAIQEYKDGKPAKEICDELGVSVATFHQWHKRRNKSQGKGSQQSHSTTDSNRLKELEDENTRLKLMYVHLSLKHEKLKEGV